MLNMNPSEFTPKQTFTTNGVFDMGQAPSNILHLKVDGNFAGASLQIGYVASNRAVRRHTNRYQQYATCESVYRLLERSGGEDHQCNRFDID